MASLASEMPPLHTAEALAGVQQTANSSSQPPPQNGGGSTSGSGGVIDSTQTSDADTGPTQSQSSSGTSNNTISAAADSSDNQPSTPQPHLTNGGDPQQPPTTPHAHHPYANHHIYAAQQPTTTSASSSNMAQMYPHNIYSSSANMDIQQQHQQQQQPQTPTQHSAYPSYLNSYEQFYQQQQQQHPSQNPQMDYINSNSNPSMYPSPADYKQQAGVRYHPYLHTPTSGLPSSAGHNSSSNNAMDNVNSQSAPVVSSASSSVMSPRVVSSTSPTSSSNHIQISGSASSIGSMSAGNPSSPASGGAPQCKKCGIMCTNDAELQEHIANVHGASPYGSSGYASSPYVKEELQQQTPPSQTQQQQQQQLQQLQQQSSQQPPVAGGNPGEILDLDSQKMLYPPGQGVMPGMMHPSVSGVTDPLQSMHSMQQRAGIATWDQQQSEGLPPYMQNASDAKNMPNHSPYYQSPKLSPYHVSNSTNVIKSEYPIIKSEYPSDSQQYMEDKSFDPTAPVSQQMMPPAVSSSPAEFPSTTTGGPQDSQQTGNQQFRATNFEPPTSSSALTTNVGTKAANWKSNEARRPKTYNCTACNKWFTSSGHLKRHYNTTLHKNAVKSSGQPDPATLPISVHHHPAREGSTGKTSRRGAAAAAATAAANAAAQQQQQPPNPVQPPEPPNSPQDYGGSQAAAGGLTPMSHYAATPSPNSMYQQQQYSHNQYMPQVQSTTNASPQHASTMAGALQPGSHHQQTIMNGHPNALAGPSVPTTRQQMPMPSSQMRGLLNSPTTTTTTTTTLILKNNHMEAAIEGRDQLVQDLEEEEQMELEQQQQLAKEVYVKEESDHSLQSTDEQLAEMEDQEAQAHNAALPHMQHQLHYQLEPQQADMERLYHNITPNNSMRVRSPLIICHQQYQEHLQLEQQMQAQATYTLTPTPPPQQQQQQLHHSIMEPQHYISIPLGINTQQHSNMLQLQPQPITTEQQQQQPDTTIPTTSMANMLPPNHLMQQQLPHTELQPLVSTQLQQQPPLGTTNISTQHMQPSHITTSNITNMPSYHQLQQQDSVLQPLDHTLTYPHTIIGNSDGGPLPSINTMSDADYITVDEYGSLISASENQLLQTADGQLVQLISTNPTTGATTLYTQAYNSYIVQGSPQEGDLPPLSNDYSHEQTMVPSTSYSPNITSSSTCSNSTETKELRASLTEDYINSNFHMTRQDGVLQQSSLDPEPQPQDLAKTTPKTTPATKRKRNPSSSSSLDSNSAMLPSGRIKCLPCDKEFTKICYLTQHNNSFHSGEYPFRCQKCGKRYQSEDIYITHLGKHKTIDKAHKCAQCPKQFHHKTDLRRHIEAIHTGNKQHSCDICSKSFCRKDHLRKHLETHNRPRVVTKRGKAAANRSVTAAFAKLQNKATTPTHTPTPVESSKSSATPPPPPPVLNQIKSEIQYQTMQIPDLISDTALTSTASPLVLQVHDVAADDNELLEDELEDYDPHELNEDEYISIQHYEAKLMIQHHRRQEQHHLQQLLVKTEQFGDLDMQSYQIIEQELPLY